MRSFDRNGVSVLYTYGDPFPAPHSLTQPIWSLTQIKAPTAGGGMASRIRRSRVLILGLVVVACAGGAYGAWRWPAVWLSVLGPPQPADRVVVSGNIEAHEAVLSFSQVQAPVIALPFDEGAAVSCDTVLAQVDDRLYRQQVEIDRTNQQVAVAQVAVNTASLTAAQNTVTSDEFDLAEEQRDYERDEVLVKTAATPVQTRDLTWTAAQQSAATLAHDRAMVQMAISNIALARANAAAADAKLKLDEVTLSYTTLKAPFSGVISVREAELGQLAGPGVAIFTLDDLDHPWLRAYVNEQDLGKVRLGEAVDVTTDTYPGKIYRGRISFPAPQPRGRYSREQDAGRQNGPSTWIGECVVPGIGTAAAKARLSRVEAEEQHDRSDDPQPGHGTAGRDHQGWRRQRSRFSAAMIAARSRGSGMPLMLMAVPGRYLLGDVRNASSACSLHTPPAFASAGEYPYHMVRAFGAPTIPYSGGPTRSPPPASTLWQTTHRFSGPSVPAGSAL